MVICFLSYDISNYYHYSIEVDSYSFDKDSIIEEAESFYKSKGVEEFFVADIWEDDNEILNQLIKDIYTENYLQLLDQLQQILESDLHELDPFKFQLIEKYSSLSELMQYKTINEIKEIFDSICIVPDIYELICNHFGEDIYNSDDYKVKTLANYLDELDFIDRECIKYYSSHHMKNTQYAYTSIDF